MDNAEMMSQKVANYKKYVAVFGGVFNLTLIFLGACVSKIPSILGVVIIIVLFFLLVLILFFFHRMKVFNRLLKELE